MFPEGCAARLLDVEEHHHVRLAGEVEGEVGLHHLLKTDQVLSPVTMEVASGGKSDYCCQKNDSGGVSTFLKVLGEGCFAKSRDVVRFKPSCEFTNYIRGGCVEEQREVARFCKIPHHNCVIKEYYKTSCYDLKQ